VKWYGQYGLFNMGLFCILMSHRSTVTFDTVCLIIFVACVSSFRWSLPFLLCFTYCFLFLISTSRHNSEKIWKIWKKNQLNTDKIWKVWKKNKLNSEKIWKIWKTNKLNSEKIWKIRKRHGLFNYICRLCFIFSLISPFSFMFYLLFSVSNFYFTSQYHQFPPPPPPPLLR
jgi:hypothetical protein